MLWDSEQFVAFQLAFSATLSSTTKGQIYSTTKTIFYGVSKCDVMLKYMLNILI